MYSVLDLKRDKVSELLDGVVEYVNLCEANHIKVDTEIMKDWMKELFEFQINLEYELWLVDNVGIDVAVNLNLFKGTMIESTEKFFCRELAKRTYAHFVDMAVTSMFGVPTFRVSQRNYVGYTQRAFAWYYKVYDEPDNQEYGSKS